MQARYRGVTGHPVLFNRSLFTELDSVTGDQGRAGSSPVTPSWPDSPTWIDAPLDIDTEADYERFLRQFTDQAK